VSAVLSPRPERLPSLDHVTSLPPATRDVALDLLRGLAIVILVVNHLPLRSPLEDVTSALLSAAEMLILVSGVVAGMVFGRRWRTHGGRATARALLRRSRTLYLASVVVVALVGAFTLVPGIAVDDLTLSRGIDHYAFDGAAATALAIVTLDAGPWQFNIMGFFVVILALTPALLWTLERGWWPLVLAGSWGLYAAGRAWPAELLPSQSETPFPIAIWQVLFVHGLLVGWHRERVAALLARHGRRCLGVLAAVGAIATALWFALDAEHFGKDRLDPLRLLLMVSLTALAYALLRTPGAQRTLGWLLLPLGRNSFYVFIMQVFVCLAVANAAGGGGTASALALQLGALALLWTMVRRRFLFRWVPR
jgi:hypothetical protein